MEPLRYLLGPQRPDSNLREAVAAARGDGDVAIVAAGWQEAEDYIDDVQELAGAPLHNLDLYRRAEAIMSADAALRDAYRERQDKLAELQRLYGLRLRQLMLAARQVYRSESDPELKRPEERHAIAQLRALDRHHLHRVEALHQQYAGHIGAAQSSILAEHRAEVLEILDGCSQVIITGGNVVVLLNRLALFNLGGELANRNLVAWSAGAMVLGGQIVLYHDRTPHGRREPEVLAPGFELLPEFVFLPDAQYRLRTGSQSRIALFSRRFAPATCLTLDSGTLLRFSGDTLREARQCRRLAATGRLERMQPA